MGEEKKGRSVGVIFIGVFIFLIVLVAGLYLIKLFFFAPPQPLPQETFSSRLEERRFWDEKQQKEIVYWVIATTNQTPKPFYNCRFSTVSKGSQDEYEGFFRNYTLKDCRQYTFVQTNYDCRLENAWQKYTQYAKSRTLRKFPAGGNSELAVSRFYLEDETRPEMSFLVKNSLSDIYGYQITCRTSIGRAVTHTQLF